MLEDEKENSDRFLNISQDILAQMVLILYYPLDSKYLIVYMGKY